MSTATPLTTDGLVSLSQALMDGLPELLFGAAMHLLALAIVYWGTTRWIPRTINDYGFAHFGFERPYYPSLIRGWLTVLGSLALVKAAALMAGTEALPFLAGMIVCLQGVIRLDRRFLVIPDRFQIVGLLSALGFVWVTRSGHGLEETLAHVALGLSLPALLLVANGLYEKLRHKTAMGLGDVKLLAWLGVAFGAATYGMLVYGMLLAAGVVGLLLILKRVRLDASFAFGPYIVAGVVTQLTLTYLQLTGPWLT